MSESTEISQKRVIQFLRKKTVLYQKDDDEIYVSRTSKSRFRKWMIGYLCMSIITNLQLIISFVFTENDGFVKEEKGEDQLYYAFQFNWLYLLMVNKLLIIVCFGYTSQDNFGIRFNCFIRDNLFMGFLTILRIGTVIWCYYIF